MAARLSRPSWRSASAHGGIGKDLALSMQDPGDGAKEEDTPVCEVLSYAGDNHTGMEQK
jgi:hypothetical protein